MKISVLAADVSSNCFGRAYVLARALQEEYDVEIIGPVFGQTVWEPLVEQNDVELRTVPGRPLFHQTVSQLKMIIDMISGNVVYASKPLITSYGVGLLDRFFHKRPLVLDIDDWQMGLQREALGRLSAGPWSDAFASCGSGRILGIRCPRCHSRLGFRSHDTPCADPLAR